MAKAQTEIVAPTTKSLHGRLKDIVNAEIAKLPELLEQLEPKERVRTNWRYCLTRHRKLKPSQPISVNPVRSVGTDNKLLWDV